MIPLVFSQPNSPDARVAAVRLYLGGDRTGAYTAAKEASAISTRQHGEDDWRTAADLFRLAFFAGQADRPDEADQYMRQASMIVMALKGEAAAEWRLLVDDQAEFYQEITPSKPRGVVISGTSDSAPSRLAMDSSNSDRVALVIGNDKYDGLPALGHAVSDAVSVRLALEAAGFRVTFLQDGSLERTVKVTDEFIRALRPAEIVLFYYAGHAFQIDNENFLAPVDYRGADPRKEAYPLSELHERIVNAQSRVQILILDSCRTSPSSASSISAAQPWFRRLARMPLARNSLIAYSTQDDSAARDDGTYARALTRAMQEPGLEIRDLFKQIRKSLDEETEGHQVPWHEENLLEDFFFHPPTFKWNAKDGLDYIKIPSGTFLMGCVSDDNLCESDEKPQHPVTLSRAYWIGQTEVTVRAYKLFADATGRKLPEAIISVNPDWRDDAHPIVKVSWPEAEDFCRWAADGGRLPTEAEWEYAARGGLPGAIWPEQEDFAWKYTRPSTLSAINRFGVMGIANNAEEWVADWYGNYALGSETDPVGPESGAEKVVRGGYWTVSRRLSDRVGVNPNVATSGRGFRCVAPALVPKN